MSCENPTNKKFFFLNFHPNEADKHNSLFSLELPKVSGSYFNYKKSDADEKKLITWSRGSSKT